MKEEIRLANIFGIFGLACSGGFLARRRMTRVLGKKEGGGEKQYQDTELKIK